MRRNFTLLEMSIALVIVCILCCSFLVGLKIIQDNKVATIIAESSSYRDAIINFHNNHDALPGNLSDDILRENFVYFTNLVNNCHSDNTQKNPNGKIIDQSVANCAFYQLQASGFINQVVNVDKSLTKIIRTNDSHPASKSDKFLSWHIISSNIGDDNTSLPIETSIPNGDLQKNGYGDRLMLVITRSSFDKIGGRSAVVPKLDRAENEIAGLNVKIAMLIDKKIDTGLPYTGSVISGRNAVDISNGMVDVGCTKLSSVLNAKSINKTATYNTNQSDALCITAFMLPRL